MRNRNRMIFIITACVLIALMIIMSIKGCSNGAANRTQEDISNGVKWNGERDYVPKPNTLYGYIPGFTELTFGAGETHQYVNFYNPNQNTVSANLTLKLDNGHALWSASNVKPGYGFYEIDLAEPLSRGEYRAQLIYDFYSDNGSKYNGGIIPFTLHVV